MVGPIGNADDLCQGNNFMGRVQLFIVHQMHKG
jgi:hypothetical protein